MNVPTPPDVTVRRSYQVYVYAVCFVAVFVLLFAAAEGTYSLVRIAAPGTTIGSGSFGDPGESAGAADSERKRGEADLIRNLILGAFAFAIFSFHWRRAAEIREELDRALAAPPPAPAPEPERAPVELGEPPAPRRRPPPRTKG